MRGNAIRSDKTVRYTKFLGLNKSNDPVAFSMGENAIKLAVADNVNISRDLKPERRDGYALWLSGNFTSLWGNKRNCFGVESGSLVQFSTGATKLVLATGVGSEKMSFVDGKNGFIYYANGVAAGKIGSSGATSLGTSSDQFKATLPIGDFVSYLSPRVLMVKGSVIYISDAVNRDVYHKEYGFIQFESSVRMVSVVGANLYVSDSTSTWFLQRIQGSPEVPAPRFKMNQVLGYPAVSGNASATIYNIRIGEELYPEAAAWVTGRGVCIGTESGTVVNLTEDKYEIPGYPVGGTIFFRRVNDLNLLVSIFKSSTDSASSGTLGISVAAPNLLF